MKNRIQFKDLLSCSHSFEIRYIAAHNLKESLAKAGIPRRFAVELERLLFSGYYSRGRDALESRLQALIEDCPDLSLIFDLQVLPG